jgi:hypothetical protein
MLKRTTRKRRKMTKTRRAPKTTPRSPVTLTMARMLVLPQRSLLDLRKTGR